MIDHIVESKATEAKGASPDDIMKHPDVIKLINQHGKERKALEKDWQQKLENKEKEINKQNLFLKVKAQALAEFRNLNPILPEDAKKAQALEDVLLHNLEKFNYQDTDDGFSVLKEDGTALIDDHGYPVTFQSHVKAHAERYFDFKKAEERSSSGNTQQSNPGKKVRMPKDKDDFVNIMKDQTLTPQERIEINKLWTSKK